MPLDPADVARLRDMVDFSAEAIALLGALDPEQLRRDRRTLLAVCRCIEVVGEAGVKVSLAVKSANREVPWELIVGMRHRLVHDYGRVDPAIVHRVVVVDLPVLLRQLQQVLDPVEEIPKA